MLAGRLAVDIQVMVRLRRGGTFGYPADLSSPILMIGPGTGVCPFRGFLQHRSVSSDYKRGLPVKSCLTSACKDCALHD